MPKLFDNARNLGLTLEFLDEEMKAQENHLQKIVLDETKRREIFLSMSKEIPTIDSRGKACCYR